MRPLLARPRLARPRLLLVVTCLLGVVASPLSGQTRPLSVWLGAARPVGRDSLEQRLGSLRNVDLTAALQLDAPLLPVALRADVSIVAQTGGDFADGRRNGIVSAVMPVRLPVVQPYAIAGYAVYDWGRPLERRGISYGAGVRLQLGGLGVFGQVRRHEPLDRSLGTVGLVF